MNLTTAHEDHLRDEAFDREDAKHHRETCSPAGNCYIPFVANVRGEPHYCNIHRPEPPCLTAFWGATDKDPIAPCRYLRGHSGRCEASNA